MAQCEERRRRELDEALNREAVSGRGERGRGGEGGSATWRSVRRGGGGSWTRP